METLVFPAQDQLSQHHHWQKRNVLFSPPRSTPPRKSDALLSPPKASVARSCSGDFPSGWDTPGWDSASVASVARSLSASGWDLSLSTANDRLSQDSPARKEITPKNKTTSPKQHRKIVSTVKVKSKQWSVKKAEKNSRKDEGAAISPSKITILQRPQSKEAAMVDLAKITGLTLSEVYAKNGLSPPRSEGFIKHKDQKPPVSDDQVKQVQFVRTSNKAKDKVDRSKAAVEVLRSNGFLTPGEKLAVSAVANTTPLPKPRFPSQKLEVVSAEVAQIDSETEVLVKNVSVAEEEMAGESIKQVQVMIKDKKQQKPRFCAPRLDGFPSPASFGEKWAGPAFGKSPPPSAVPMPKSPWRKSELVIDIEAATKGLRRILNLDF